MADIHQNKDPHGRQPVARAGTDLADAGAAIILIHGRGATAESILELGHALAEEDPVALLAPQAAANTWYPHSFLAPMEENQPGIDSGLGAIARVVAQVEQAGVPTERIILAGFSQGACLASEYMARNPRPMGGLLIFSGGVIGPPGTPRDYQGNLGGMPVFIGCSDIDPHIPLERVHETAEVFEELGGLVTRRIYPGLGHLINRDELRQGRMVVESHFEDETPQPRRPLI